MKYSKNELPKNRVEKKIYHETIRPQFLLLDSANIKLLFNKYK